MRVKRLLLGVSTMVMAATMLLGTNVSDAAAQACWDCGAYRGEECKRTEACVWALWGRICTTEILRYPAIQ